MTKQPLPYDAAYEVPEKDEAHVAAELAELLVGMAEKMVTDAQSDADAAKPARAMRAVHAKNNGLILGKLRVLDGLPAELAQGMFSKPAEWDTIMRLSAPPTEELSDKVSTPRALAMKVLGVEGERLAGSEGDSTQDFLMVNGPVFNASNAAGFLRQLKLLGATTDKAPRAKELLSAVLRGTEKVIESLGGESKAIKGMGGHPQTHPLGETYFTQVPVLYGKYMAKLSLAPVSAQLLALTDAQLHDKGDDAIRAAVAQALSGNNGSAPLEWELRVQLCTDIESMPIEDASVQWPEDVSPFVAVARLSAWPQEPQSVAELHIEDDRLAFNPWHGIAAHRPLGSVMRVRKMAYRASSEFRSSHNGCPLHEPSAREVQA